MDEKRTNRDFLPEVTASLNVCEVGEENNDKDLENFPNPHSYFQNQCIPYFPTS